MHAKHLGISVKKQFQQLIEALKIEQVRDIAIELLMKLKFLLQQKILTGVIAIVEKGGEEDGKG